MAATPEEKERLRRGSRRNVGVVVAVIVIALVLVAVAVLAGLFNPTTGQKVTLLGSGATFPYPLITKWSSVYVNDTGGRVQVNYQGIGSGAGIQAITAKTVDFAGSDAPLKPSERAAAPGLLHIPETIGAVTAGYNVASLSSGLNLTGHVLGEIFLGKITTWNHANISALNPGVVLPSSTITVVHRSDSSGTTFVWTNYLHLANPGWNSSVAGKSIGRSVPQAKAQALVDFLWWCVHNPGGQQYAAGLVYPTLPQTVVTLDEQAIRSITFNAQTLHS